MTQSALLALTARALRPVLASPPRARRSQKKSLSIYIETLAAEAPEAECARANSADSAAWRGPAQRRALIHQQERK